MSTVACEVSGAPPVARSETGSAAETVLSSDQSFACPELVVPGSDAKRRMRPAVNAYLRGRRPDGTRGFSYEVTRLGGVALRWGPEGECPLRTWRRSFEVEGSFDYKTAATNQSASLGYFRVVVGRTEAGWIVWAEPH